MPSSTPSVLPLRRRVSLAAASWKTLGLIMGMLLRQGPRESYVNMRIRYLATNSTLVIEWFERAVCKSSMLASMMDYRQPSGDVLCLLMIRTTYFSHDRILWSCRGHVRSLSTSRQLQSTAFKDEHRCFCLETCTFSTLNGRTTGVVAEHTAIGQWNSHSGNLPWAMACRSR
jgi:hypothetical protein